jgi:hypothetical protein
MAVLLLTAIVSATFVLASPSTPDGSSQAQGPVTVGFDMDPANTPANSCPNDGTDCTLGTIETCVQVATGGGSVEFDVFLDDLPNGDSILGFVYTIGEETSTVLGPVTAYTHQDGMVNLPAQPGSSTFDFSDAAGTNVPGFDANVGDMGTAEYNPPFTHGTLGRYTLDTTGVADGVYGLTLSTVILGNKESNDLCTLYVCNILDAYDANGLIAVGVPCPLPDSVGGIARLPEVSDSSGRNYVTVAALAAAALVVALTAGTWYARRRWLR